MGAASAPGASASFLDQAAGDGLNIMPPSVHWSLAAIGDAQTSDEFMFCLDALSLRL
jgi:hypothetical protein